MQSNNIDTSLKPCLARLNVQILVAIQEGKPEAGAPPGAAPGSVPHMAKHS